jgi:peptidoglycan/LPS O-acetylase OafA/YrhL
MNATTKLNNIQVLRAFAALGVVVIHSGLRLPYMKGVGAFGVDVFFVISGYIWHGSSIRIRGRAATFSYAVGFYVSFRLTGSSQFCFLSQRLRFPNLWEPPALMRANY